MADFNGHLPSPKQTLFCRTLNFWDGPQDFGESPDIGHDKENEG